MPVADVKPPDDPELRALAVNLRRLREQHGLSRQELADQVGATLRQVEHWENEESWPAARHLVQLSRLFHQPIESLMFDPATGSLDQTVRYIRAYVDVLTKMTGASIILNVHLPLTEGLQTADIDIRAVPDASADGVESIVEVKGSISTNPQISTEPDCQHV